MVESTNEFIQIARSINKLEIRTSRDVKNVFTNVPVEEIIEIILEKVYNHHEILPPNVPRVSPRNISFICTTKSSLKTPRE